MSKLTINVDKIEQGATMSNGKKGMGKGKGMSMTLMLTQRPPAGLGEEIGGYLSLLRKLLFNDLRIYYLMFINNGTAYCQFAVMQFEVISFPSTFCPSFLLSQQSTTTTTKNLRKGSTSACVCVCVLRPWLK